MQVVEQHRRAAATLGDAVDRAPARATRPETRDGALDQARPGLVLLLFLELFTLGGLGLIWLSEQGTPFSGSAALCVLAAILLAWVLGGIGYVVLLRERSRLRLEQARFRSREEQVLALERELAALKAAAVERAAELREARELVEALSPPLANLQLALEAWETRIPSPAATSRLRRWLSQLVDTLDRLYATVTRE